MISPATEVALPLITVPTTEIASLNEVLLALAVEKSRVEKCSLPKVRILTLPEVCAEDRGGGKKCKSEEFGQHNWVCLLKSRVLKLKTDRVWNEAYRSVAKCSEGG